MTVELPVVICNNGPCNEQYEIDVWRAGGTADIDSIDAPESIGVPGMTCRDFDVTVVIGSNAEPGTTATIKVEAETSSNGTCDPRVTLKCSATATVSLATVSQVVWEVYDPSNEPLGDCPNNGGRRIFPGKLSPDDGFVATRQKVYLKATVTPVVEDCDVHFKVWDVDDPFDQLNANMPNVSLIDNNTSGPDNRGTDPAPGSYTATTGAGGGADDEAKVTITVSMQPGNNYRAGASVMQSAINGTTQPQADANTPPQHVIFTDMLTVWRKLHVEVDSMAMADFTNTQSGNIPAAPTFDPATNRAMIPLAGLESEFNAPDQHKVGRIDILTYGSFTTLATDVSDSPYQVKIGNAPANIVNATGLWYTLWDDDAGSVPPFVMVGFNVPPVTLPRVPDTGLMAELFVEAYVDVPPPDMQYYDQSPFDWNVADDAEVRVVGGRSRDLQSTAEYWAVHITSAFQGFVGKDNDPDTEEASPGLQYGVTGVPLWAPWRRLGSLIYLETIRDHAKGNLGVMLALERYTVVHESGHQFKLEHEDGRWPTEGDLDPSGDYIMTDKTDETGMAPNVAFGAKCLKKIREIDYPPQP